MVWSVAKPQLDAEGAARVALPSRGTPLRRLRLQLERLAADGLLTRGTGMGRNAHFAAGPRLSQGDRTVGSS